MERPLHILAISGSLRKGSYNSAALRAAGELLPPGVTLEQADLGPIPHYNGDVETAGYPDPVRQLRERITAADALLIATPEYNGSIPGVLKNALDWASRPTRASPLRGKPVAMLGAGGARGTARAQAHLRDILVVTGAQLVDQPGVYLAHAWDLFDADGRLLDETTRRKLRQLIATITLVAASRQAERDEEARSLIAAAS